MCVRCCRNNKLFLVWVAMLFVSFLGIVGVIYYLSSPTNVCTTFECKRAGAELNASMDRTVDPCDDFYQYTCGNWAEQHPQPNDTTMFDWSNIITQEILWKVDQFLKENSTEDEAKPVRQAKKMFATCMDTDQMEEQGYTPLFALLKDLSLPVVPTFFRPTTAKKRQRLDWIKPIVRMKQSLKLQVLINFDIVPELTNGNVNRVIFDIPKPRNETALKQHEQILRKMRRKRSIDLLDDSDESDDEEEEEEDEELEDGNQKIEYMTHVINAVLNASKKPYPVQLEKIVEGAMIIVNIQDTLKEFIKAVENSTDSLEILEDIRNETVASLQQLVANGIPSGPDITIFEKYLNFVFDGMPDHVKFNQATEKVLTSGSDILYFSVIINYLQESLSVTDIELYIWWCAVETAVTDTNEDMRVLYTQYITDLEEATGRDDYCVGDVDTMMGLAVSGAIINQEFLDGTKPKIELMVHNIRKVFAQNVEELDWMDERSKKENLEKLERMKTLIGFPEWLLNKTALEEYYQDLTLTHTSHLSNRVEINRWNLRKELLEWRSPPKLNWETTPTTVNAFYLPRTNAIAVPQAFLQYPYYYMGLESLNYGSLGTFLGHELTHGFDNTGRILDKFGNYIAIWTSNNTKEQYDERAQCFIDQYGSLGIPELEDATVDGELTLDENIADNGGLREAIQAYRLYKLKAGPEELLPGFEGYTEEQLFFLSFGNSRCESYSGTGAKDQLEDSHAPGRVRVNAVLSNSDEFKAAFQCKIGSGMFPESHKQCQIW